jgi:hypothetical protein
LLKHFYYLLLAIKYERLLKCSLMSEGFKVSDLE